MAYVTQYTAHFKNEQNQDIYVYIDKKNGSSVTVENYEVVNMRIITNGDENDAYACILGKELELELWSSVNQTISWSYFMTSSHDDWKITVQTGGQTLFVGFILVDQSFAPLQDKPYIITLKATDGLGLLKGYRLKDVNGNYFVNFNTLTQYIAGALKSTGLDLNIRIFCSYFNAAQLNKGNGLIYDMFSQTALSSRSLMENGTDVMYCYDALKFILGGWCQIEQYNGKWYIMTISEKQYIPENKYYVDYNSSGTAIVGGIDNEPNALIGRNELIYPVNESQTISSVIACNSAKTIFEYKEHEIYFDNQYYSKLGTLIEQGTYTYTTGGNDRRQVRWTTSTNISSTGTWENYNVIGWKLVNGDLTNYSLFNGELSIYVKYDIYKNERARELAVVRPLSGNLGVLGVCAMNTNDDFYVNIDADFSINIKWQSGSNPTLQYNVAQLAILTEESLGLNSTDWWTLSYETDALGKNTPKWYNDDQHCFIGPTNTSFKSLGTYKELSVEKTRIPTNGKMYIRLGGQGDTASFITWGNIDIQYKNQKIGSTKSINGEYHINSQDSFFVDTKENKIKINDGPYGSVKGAMFFYGPYSEPGPLKGRFYRHPATAEVKTFKQLVNYGVFNQHYRRFYKIEGDYRSFVYNISTDQNMRKLIGFHKTYLYKDFDPDRQFVLIPPLEIDVFKGNIKANLVEVKKDSNDGTQTGNVDKLVYIF